MFGRDFSESKQAKRVADKLRFTLKHLGMSIKLLILFIDETFDSSLPLKRCKAE